MGYFNKNDIYTAIRKLGSEPGDVVQLDLGFWVAEFDGDILIEGINTIDFETKDATQAKLQIVKIRDNGVIWFREIPTDD